MGMDTALDSAQAEVTTACAALKTLQHIDFWKTPELDLLGLAQSIEGLARLGYAAQVRVAGEVDTRHTAANFGSASTVALLRETLTISAPDARARVNTAKMVLPQTQPSGGVADPVLPELAAALAEGSIGVEQTRIVVATIKVPGTPTPGCWKKQRRSSSQRGR
jgi:phage tail protein X